ncbi:glycine oxidase ThiO [Streptomyces asiaticus]
MHAVVVGGGVIGLSVAWRALERGLDMTVVDPEPALQASHASAGLLPPANELLYRQKDLSNLYLASRARYPSFVADLEEVSGHSAGFRKDGLLDVAFDDESHAGLDTLRTFLASVGVSVDALTAEECRREEPRLAPTVRGGLRAPQDGSVNPRDLMTALTAALAARGGRLVRERAVEVRTGAHGVTGVRLGSGTTLAADQVVLAAGCWTHRLTGLPDGVVPAIRPVKGQILRLRSPRPYLRRATRALADGWSLYLVPRHDGELVVGATYEECGYDTAVTVAGLSELLSKLNRVLPGTGDLHLAEAGVGLRPAALDDLPVLGTTSVPGLILATGHCRIGVQLTPITADAISELLVTGRLPEVAEPFTAARFAA